ncbi:MAG TPA: sigma-54-dependent Fis family transcriptional regulator [Proteobacteria bacterium]|mgnify:CR=1 FL=1|nr:sigma-54-dependent Fis family transcriptional regulator [Pseudomonadota bacterium]
MNKAGQFCIVVVDDEERAVTGLVELLRLEGFVVDGYSRPQAALDHVRRHPVDLLLTDLRMPEVDGLELLRLVRAVDPGLSVVMITGQGGVRDAVAAMKAGADDYLIKPINLEELEITIARIREKRELLAQNRLLREAALRGSTEFDFIGSSPAMEKIFRAIRDVAPTMASVLIEGETGTGKELVARSLHRSGLRSEKPLITINCAALHEGLLESELFGHVKGAFTGAVRNKLGKFALADGGTIFLDEIGDMAMSVQAKLLRVLVSGEFQQVGGEKTHYVDVRVLAATNKDLRAEVAAGRFREDLYYRLNVVQFILPPLRDRSGDIVMLVKYFCEKISRRDQRPLLYPESEAMRLLENAPWPGNVRELENVMERAFIYAKDRPIGVDDLPLYLQENRYVQKKEGGSEEPGEKFTLVGLSLKEMEKRMILAALERCPTKTQAARELGISVRKIEYRLKEWGRSM